MSTLLARNDAGARAESSPRLPTPPAAIGYVALALLAYVPALLTAPGRVAADTKQYLYLDPGRLISRAVSMWDPNVGMGTVTHQTIGYVFPMGPYYWMLDKLGVPDWVAQRLWLGSLLFFAAAGVLYLLRTFGLRGPGVVVAALAYMLTPYVLDYAARISVLLMPWAALPWMIAVLRKALKVPPEDGRLAQWRYPAIFALIVQVIGGVNATALLFAVLGAMLWVVYAWLGAHEVSLRHALGVTVRTGLLTVFASLWWIAGLRMQAAYGLDILRYTETVDAVARTSSPNEVLRGLGYWFFYGQDRLGPWIEAARDYTQHIWIILSGYGLAALGLLGAGVLNWKHRLYFIGLLFTGVVIAVGAHPYAHPTPLGALFKAVSRSSTAALAMRSTGRAVPLVVLALAVFLGIGTNVAVRRLRDHKRFVLALSVPALAVVVLLVNFPALYNGTYYGKNLQRPEHIPAYWTQAIAALSARGDSTRILEEPGADFASYRWGNTVDPITPGLTDRPYVARELIPYGTAGSADLLNAIDRRIQEGVADPRGLVALWRRMGIGDVVARNDIQYERFDLVAPRDLDRLLAQTPGLGPAQPYGPPSNLAAPGYYDEISLGDPPNEPLLAPVVVYPVTDPTPIVHAAAANGAVMMSGDGEGMIDAADAGLLDGPSVVRYSASYPTADALRRAIGNGDVLVVTDNNRLRARKWTSVKDNLGYTEQANGADKPLVTDNGDARLPLFPGEPESAYTTTQDVGVARVRATAYGNTITYTPEDRAANALDGDVSTAWRANAFGDARGQRIRIDLDGPITTDHVNLVQPQRGGRNRVITKIEISFDGKNAVTANLDGSSRTTAGQTITFARRTFRRIDITVKETSDHRTNLFGREDSVGFAEIRLRNDGAAHDVHLTEIEQMPTDLVDALGAATAGHPLVLVMSRDAVRPVPPRSQPELSIVRAFTLPTARAFVLTGDATVSTDASAADVDAALGIADAAHGGVTVRSSAALPGCLQCRADAALDGDPLTAWQTPFDDVRSQWAEFTVPKAVSFDHLDLRVIADHRHSVPTKLTLQAGGVTRHLTLPAIADGPTENASTLVRLTFPRVTGKTIRVTIDDVREEDSVEFGGASPLALPAGIAELGVPGVALPRAPAQLDSGCRRDLVTVDGRPLPVRITGRAAAAGRVDGLTVTPCDPARAGVVPSLTLGPGRHVLTTARGPQTGWSLDKLVFASSAAGAAAPDVASGRVVSLGTPPPASTPTVQVTNEGRTSVRVHVTNATQPFWMVLGQSHSSGWRAHVVGGRGLGDPQLVDGYANGWFVTPQRAAFDIAMDWTPQRQVWASLWLSLLTALLCAGIIALTWRRRVVLPAAPSDAAVTIAAARGTPLRGRARWLAPVIAGLLAALTVAPWVGVVVGVLAAVIASRPQDRRWLMVVPAVLLAGCGAYIALQQYRFRFPPVFEWPTLFTRARTPAWLAVMILAGDAIVQWFRARDRGG